MNDSMTAVSLSDFLGRIGLPQAARDRVVEIDRILADELVGDEPDADGCADLVLEAAGLIADLDPTGFDWKDWDDDDHPGDVDGFDFHSLDWGAE
ncbi:hypothetical protein HLH89_06355 [Rhizobium laguerreae]|uniref:hypothetical protein n=1 Tax=Rhizobium laguerreae TaxID=1076926 RepID=UPI001478B873|nr:hypothetical protein [Rhizobium laguerreae]NNH80651.1 hypothetical protein [Rhizobium laguerreae]